MIKVTNRTRSLLKTLDLPESYADFYELFEEDSITFKLLEFMADGKWHETAELKSLFPGYDVLRGVRRLRDVHFFRVRKSLSSKYPRQYRYKLTVSV